jgi:TolA-binding protein
MRLIAFTTALQQGDIVAARVTAAQIGALATSAQNKPYQLYIVAGRFASASIPNDANIFYQRILTEYPGSQYAGPDYAGFHLKWIVFTAALRNGDIAAARATAAQIESLSCSAANKPNQLYQLANQFEFRNFPQDANRLYQRILTEYPDSPFAGPDRAGFRIKWNAFAAALEQKDVTSARATAAEIETLAASPDKPHQLFLTANRFENKGYSDDANMFYQQIIAQYPASLYSGPDYAGFHIKWIAFAAALHKGDIATARATAPQIESLACSAESKPKQLYWVASEFETHSFREDANAFYEQVFTNFPDSSWGHKARIHKDCIDWLKYIDNNDLAAAKSSIPALKAKYVGDDLEMMLFLLGESSYLTGLKNNQTELFYQSASIFENEVSALDLCNNSRAAASYMEGLNYYGLGEYTQAATAFGRSYQSDPNFEFAFYCMYAVANCLDKARYIGKVTDINSTTVENSYMQFIDLYPGTDYTDCATLRLGEMYFDDQQVLKGLACYSRFVATCDQNDPRRIYAQNKLDYYGRRIEGD